jgi:hypothetical protein
MSFNLYEGYLVGRERRADAMRDADHWRLIKSLQEQGGSSGRLHRLGLSLRRLLLVHPDHGSCETSPRTRETSPRAHKIGPRPRKTVPSPRL